MTNQIIRVGVWEGAPFKGSLFRGIDRVNEFLKEKDLDVSYAGELLNVDAVKEMNNKQLPHILFLDGGEDINPRRYREENRYSHFSNRRDSAEFALTDIFQSWGRRMSGVCRGHQLLNVYFGGNLWQDIHNDGAMHSKFLASHSGGHKVKVKRVNIYPNSARHLSKNDRMAYTKKMRYKRNHIISRYTGNSPFTVSSMHHQAVKNLGRDLGVSLIFGSTKNSPSYLIEGIESSNGYIRGVQSHPEFNGYPKDGLLFSYLLHVDEFIDGIIEPDIDAVKKRLKIKKSEAVIPFDTRRMQRLERNPDREAPRGLGDMYSETQSPRLRAGSPAVVENTQNTPDIIAELEQATGEFTNAVDEFLNGEELPEGEFIDE